MHDSRYYFEDLPPGTVVEMGTRAVSAEEIMNFAREFDPQPFHIDVEAAARSPYGGLIASGWHTMAMVMRLMVDGLFNRSVSYGSPGVDNLRWPKPVRPGDVLKVSATVIDARPSESRPERGTIRLRTEAYNQRKEMVLTMEGIILFARFSDS